LMSPSMAVHKQEQMTPVMANAQFPAHNATYGQSIRGPTPSNGNRNGMRNESMSGNKQSLMEVPSGLFYPFFPERKVIPNRNGPPQDFSEMLAVAGAQAGGPYAQDTFAVDEDPAVSHPTAQMWLPTQQNTQRGVLYPVPPT